MNLKKVRTYLGAGLLIGGSLEFVGQGRVLATFILDTMMMTIGVDWQSLPPKDFSWGAMVINSSLSELQWSVVSFAMCLFGIFLLVPNVKALSPDGGRLRRALLVLIGLSLLIASIGTWYLGFRMKQEMMWMSQSGAPDPLSFGESLPVTLWNFARVALCLAAMAMASLAVVGGCKPVKEGEPRSMMLPFVYVFAGLHFVVLMAVAAGPIKKLCVMAQPGQAADPAQLAGHIASALQSIQMAGLVLGASTIFAWIAVFNQKSIRFRRMSSEQD